MDFKTLQAALNHAPFRPIHLLVDGRTVRVRHPEQGFISSDQSPGTVAGRVGGLAILDSGHISRLSFTSQLGSKAAA